MKRKTRNREPMSSSNLGARHKLFQLGLTIVYDHDRTIGEIIIEKGEQLDEKTTHRVRASAFELQKNNRRPRTRLGLNQSSQPLISREDDAILQKGQLQDLGQGEISGTDLDGVNCVVARSLELLDDQNWE